MSSHQQKSPRKTLMSSSGWTPVPNWLLDSMDQFDPVQFKIMVFLARQLYGFEHPDSSFGIRRIAKGTGIPRSTVQYHLARMIASGHLVEIGRGRGGARRLGFTANRPNALADAALSDSPPLVDSGSNSGQTGHFAARPPGHQNKKETKTMYVHKTLDAGSGSLEFLRSRLSASTYRYLEHAVSVRDGRIHPTVPLPPHLRRLIDCIGATG